MDIQKAALLAERGRIFLDREEFEKAEESFVKAIAEADDPVVRNNLAMARFLMGKTEAALETLESVKDEWPNPYRKSLMAQCLVALERMTEAKAKVREAVRDFEQLVKMDKTGIALEGSWYQYTVMVMRAAGATADHHQVLDLYKRWQKYHVNWENKYLAGVAAFNLKRFRQAASYWSGIKELFYAQKLQLVCVLAEHGIVMPFVLEYRVITEKFLTDVEQAEDYAAMMATSGLYRMFLLTVVFEENGDKKVVSSALEALIIQGGQWGRSFGLELLDAGIVPEGLKIMAAQALVKAGVFAEGEEVPIMVDGKERLIKVSQVEVTWQPGNEILEAYNRAIKLRDRGKTQEALDLLEKMSTGSVIFPPALLVLANLYRDIKKRDKAEMLLETLVNIEPEHPIFLYNLAGFWLEAGERDKAKEYADRIDTRQANREFTEKVAWLKSAIEFNAAAQVSYYRELQRIEYEDRKLPTEPTLARGLKNMPVQWVREACAFWKVGCEYRKEGEAALAEAAGDAANIRLAFLRLQEDERELLSYLLAKGGFARVSAVTRKFGSMEGDGFLEEQGPPRSALGRLWLKAFVFVGRALLNGRNEKIATIPLELREELRRELMKGA